MQHVLSQQDPKAIEKPENTMFLMSVEAAGFMWKVLVQRWFPYSLGLCGCTSLASHQSPSLECQVQPLPAQAGPSLLGMTKVCTRSRWCRDRLWAEPGLTAGWWQPWCQEKRGFASEGAAVCDHQVTEDKQKGLGATGWLEMSVKGKERDERRCRSMDYFCYRSC